METADARGRMIAAKQIVRAAADVSTDARADVVAENAAIVIMNMIAIVLRDAQ